MAKRKTPHEMNGGSALPSREAVQEFIRTQPTPVGKREIARHFGIKGDSRVALKRLLREMQIEGTVERKGKALANAGALPPVVLADVVTRDRDGDLVAKPTEWDEEDLGKPPRISVHFPRKPRPGMAVPGIGDRVLLRIEPDREGGLSRSPHQGAGEVEGPGLRCLPRLAGRRRTARADRQEIARPRGSDPDRRRKRRAGRRSCRGIARVSGSLRPDARQGHQSPRLD